MRKLTLVLVMLASWTCPWSASAQDSAGSIIYSKFRQFRIPFNAGPAESRIKQLQLFVSTDQGRSWQASAIAPPEQRHFRFLADRDGYFWFTVQTQDTEGKLYPPALAEAQPSLKVIIDTTPPQVVLQPLPPRSGEVGVRWDIRDENPDLALADAVRLEFRPASSVMWYPLAGQPQANQLYWNPNSPGLIEVRLKARDRAGNWGEGMTSVSANANLPAHPPQGFTPLAPNNVPAGVSPVPDSERKLVNSKRINLNYELKEVGPSGVSQIELWFTQDGRGWHKYPPRPGEDPTQKVVSFEVAGEGLYGITLVARSGVGLSQQPPQIGERPQIWIEVDMTRPVVQLHNVVVGQGADKGKLTISWSAFDKNLHREPIMLSYAEQPTGPWTPIAKSLANTGRYVWVLPEQVPFQFHVRVEAIDQAGNVGEAATDAVIKVDLSQPKVNITNVVPGM